ncbi:MAG: family 1 glycosylhydrolase [Trichococcus flocculiformis]|uniref:Family 1 glycosylhydrolase n=1 Tax=Trichococcus flocculiformis TaxID=82803 RepID=A0A847D3V6_9LACT|nr:family 1 glycosylhydrolase [Trichococcus flocculiformis]
MFRSPEDLIFGGATAAYQEGVDLNHKVFAECEKEGMLPFVTLHHFDTTKRLFDQGNFLNRDTMDAFVVGNKMGRHLRRGDVSRRRARRTAFSSGEAVVHRSTASGAPSMNQ